jgi:DNA-binding transcriptional LysR family regulator
MSAHGGRERDPWLAIEMRHLAALATVAREASFSGAADSLGYVQSAISQQIAYLERTVGHRLVDRSSRPRSVTLTDAGEVLLDHAEQILGRLRRTKEEIDALTRDADRAAKVGIAAVFGTWLPAALLAELLPAAGGAGRSRLDRGSSCRLLAAVAAGRLDAAFVELPIAAGPFSAIELLRAPCVVVVPTEARPHDASVEAALRRWSLVVVDDCRATQAVLDRFGGDLEVRHTAETPASALPFVRARVGAAVMTRHDLPPRDESVTALPLPSVPDRVLGLAWHRERDGCRQVVALRAAARRAFAAAGRGALSGGGGTGGRAP